MKLQKDDRIISNADYEKLVGLAELHESVIAKVVTETIHLKVFEIQSMVNRIENTHRRIILINNRYHEAASKAVLINSQWEKTYDDMVTLKNEIIQEKNAEIARLQKKYWWKLI